METTTIMSDKARPPLELAAAERDALVPALLTLSTGLVERGAVTAVGLLRDVSSEAKEAVGATLDLIEAWSKGALRLTRRISERGQGLADDTLERGELLVKSLLRALRVGGESAAGAASQTTSAVIGRGARAASA